MKTIVDSMDLTKLIMTINVIICIGILTFIVYSSVSVFGKVSDFPEYYAPAKMIKQGCGASSFVITKLADEQHQLFPSMGNRVVLLFIPPQGLALISPIGLINASIAYFVWKVLLVSCLIGSTIFLISCFALNYKQTCYLICALCLSHPCIETLRIDQLAVILLLGFSGAIYFLRKKNDFLAGLFLSVIFLKPQQLLPFLVYLIGLRRWRPFVVLSAIFLLLTFIAFLQIGASGLHNYSALVSSPNIAAYMQPELNPTLRGQLLRLFPTQAHTIFNVSVIIYALGIIFAYFFGQRMRKHSEVILPGVLAIIPIGLVTSIHCHSYDLLLLLPSLIAIFTGIVLPFTPRFKFVVIAAVITFLFPLATAIHYDYLLKGGQINLWFIELLILAMAIIYQVNQKTDTKAIPR